jgi:hypothetical protein
MTGPAHALCVSPNGWRTQQAGDAESPPGSRLQPWQSAPKRRSAPLAESKFNAKGGPETLNECGGPTQGGRGIFHVLKVISPGWRTGWWTEEQPSRSTVATRMRQGRPPMRFPDILSHCRQRLTRPLTCNRRRGNRSWRPTKGVG